MGLQVDWEVEAERERVTISGEDPEVKRARRRATVRFFLVLFGFLAVIALIIGAIAVRWRYVTWQDEQALRDTIASEVTALRIGDRALFLELQRSASEDWAITQSSVWDQYQQLKQTQEVNFTGRVVDMTIDDQRARILIEELINGAPYGRVWFYWRYEDGWHHVPPDYTFWGQRRTLTSNGLTVEYQSFDQTVAASIANVVDGWLHTSCVIDCVESLIIEIVPAPDLTTNWAENDTARIVFSSPYVREARLDLPFNPVAQLEIANLLARRVVENANGQSFDPNSEAEFLKRAAAAWLVGRYLNVSSGAHMLDSFAQIYGDEAVGTLVRSLTPESGISRLLTIANTDSLANLPLDWRDYLTWKLNQEGFAVQVNSIESTQDAAGNPLLIASAQNSTGSAISATFALINGQWQRTG
ncbi:MAG: hypothetical protein IAE89_05340 [Anaerolineae bacterium]|nr:hypothetical protein [Anaerolineae bacterium]